MGRKAIPWSMVAFRLLIGPAMVLVAARTEAPQLWLGAMVATGFVSDVYDGILARRWGAATAALRIADSATDVVFYLCILAAALVRHLPVLRDRMWLVIVVLALEGLNMVVGWIRYHRLPSYHSYASKLWGVLLATATIALLCFDGGFWLLTLALAWGILCEGEVLAMSILLPEWTHDVKSLPRAIALRRKLRAQRLVPTGS
jgi:CDP-diacylglycerol--glycerol-3-phosphate 3-phosphatidyltransferase